MNNILQRLKLESWFKVLIVLGTSLFFVALVFPLHGLTNEQALLLSGALFLIGLGEWKNEKTAVSIKPPNIYTGPAALVQWPVRKPDLIGNLLLGTGIFLMIWFFKTLL